MRTFRVELPPGIRLANLNWREHWTKRAAATKEVRSIACDMAMEARIPRLDRVRIKALYRAPDNRKRDMSNIFPAVKAAVDGIVDAGVLIDDSDKYVLSIEMARDEQNTKGGQLLIEITEVE